VKNNSKITDINNLKYELKRNGYYWSDIINKSNSKENFISVHKLKKDSKAPSHIHENEEIVYVLKGSIEIEIENNLLDLKKNQMISIPPKTEHSLRNKNKEIAKIIIYFGTNDPFSKTIYKE